MAYIQTIAEADAAGELAELYKRAGNPDGTVDNVMKVHSLNPLALRAHFEVYVAAMHKPSPLSRAEREIIGSVVSRLNGCAYCLTHHATGLKRLLPTERKTVADAIARGDHAGLTSREAALARFAEKLTREPASMTQADVLALRNAGLDDRAIHDAAHVAAYFAYANRVALGLGAAIERFPLGQHPTIKA